MKYDNQPTGYPPLYFDLLPVLTTDEAGGFSRAAIRRRGFGIALTSVASMTPEYRVFRKPDWRELVALLESHPLVVGYNCRFFDLQVLRGLGRCRPRKICDLMKAYERNTGKPASLYRAMERTFGISLSVSAQERQESLRSGNDARAIFCMEQAISAMRQLHEFMIDNGWKL